MAQTEAAESRLEHGITCLCRAQPKAHLLKLLIFQGLCSVVYYNLSLVPKKRGKNNKKPGCNIEVISMLVERPHITKSGKGKINNRLN